MRSNVCLAAQVKIVERSYLRDEKRKQVEPKTGYRLRGRKCLSVRLLSFGGRGKSRGDGRSYNRPEEVNGIGVRESGKGGGVTEGVSEAVGVCTGDSDYGSVGCWRYWMYRRDDLDG